MRQTVLYIAMSLDGYLADRDGGVGWLLGQEGKAETADSYGDFVQGIDTVILGWNSYKQIVTQLSPDAWVYEGLQSYVLTHRSCEDTADIRFVSGDLCGLLQRLKAEEGKDIWICGGAEVIRQLLEKDLIDRYVISVIPTILGGGIRLFSDLGESIDLRLLSTRNSNGIVELEYRRR